MKYSKGNAKWSPVNVYISMEKVHGKWEQISVWITKGLISWHVAYKGSNTNFPFSHPSHITLWYVLPGNAFFQDCFKLCLGTGNGNFLRNENSGCLMTICSDDKFQETWQLETCSSPLCILTTTAQTNIRNVTQTSCATVWHKAAFLWNKTYKHSHHLSALSDNLVPPKSNRSFSHSAELSWDLIPSWQRDTHYLSCPWQSAALPSSKESVKIHLAYCSETDFFTSGLPFLAFVSSCCRELPNALPNAELARTEAFGLGISAGDW